MIVPRICLIHSRLLVREQRIQLGEHLKSVSNIEDVGFSARPSTVRIEIDRASLVDEPPANDVWFFSMAAR